MRVFLIYIHARRVEKFSLELMYSTDIICIHLLFDFVQLTELGQDFNWAFMIYNNSLINEIN